MRRPESAYKLSMQVAKMVEEGEVRIWEVATGKELRTLTGHSGLVTRVAFSPDGRYVASGSEDRTVKVWDLANRQKRFSMPGHLGAIRCLAFTPDGEKLISGSDDCTVKVWELRAME